MQRNSRKERIYGTALSYGTIGVDIIAALLYTPLVLKRLGQSGYGVYSLAMSCLSYLTLFNSGMNAAFMRFYVQTKVKSSVEVPKLNGIFLKMFSVLSCISLVLGFLLATFSENIFGDKILPAECATMKNSLYLLALMAAISVIDCVFSTLVSANERFVFGKLSSLAISVSGMLVTVVLLLAHKGVEAVMSVNLAKSIVSLLLNILYCRKRLQARFDLSSKDRMLLKSITIFAAMISMQVVMDQLNWQIDKFILARTSGTGAVSIYSVGSTLNNYFMTISMAIDGVFMPQMNSLVAKNDSRAVNELFLKVLHIQAMVACWVMTIYIFWGKNFVIRWAGAEYAESYYVGILIMLPMTFAVTLDFGMHILRAYNRQNRMIILGCIFAIVNLIISIPLAIHFGAVGSAIGTFISESLLVCFAEIITFRKQIGLDMKAYILTMLRTVAGAIPALAFGIAMRCLHVVRDNYVSIAGAVGVYTVIYAVSMWIFIMNKSEKNLIKGALSKIVRYRHGTQ